MTVSLRSYYLPHCQFRDQPVAIIRGFAISTMRKGLAAAGAVALITTGAAACGGESGTPQGKVGNAFDKLAASNTVTVGLGFDGTADQIYAAMKNEDGFTRNNAELLSSLRLSLTASSQKSFNLLGTSKSGAKGGAFAIALSTDAQGSDAAAGFNGTGLAEIRYVDQKMYLRFDLKGLAKLDPKSSTSNQLNQFLNQTDQLPSSLASVKAALKGQWVSIDPKAFQDFIKSMGAQGGGSDGSSGSADSPFGAAGPKLSAAQQRQLIEGLKRALAHNVTYKDLGHHDGADHVQVTVPARAFVKEAATDLEPVLTKLPGFQASDLTDMKNAKGVPNKNVSVDVAVKGGKLSAITFDVAQLDTQAHGPVPLKLTFKGSAQSLGAPQGATVLNPQDIMGLFMSGLPGMPGSSDTSSSDASFDS